MNSTISHYKYKWVKLFLPLYIIRNCLHLICYYHYRTRKELTMFADNELKINGICGTWGVIKLNWLFSYDEYFLTYFYHFIGCRKASILSIFRKDRSTLTILCPHIGANMKMYHPFSTIINCKSIGDNFQVLQNTTIGNKDGDQNKRPIIGNNVHLGANVIIFGDITIGDNVTIGAGALVNKDVPSNCIVIGNPMRIIKKK